MPEMLALTVVALCGWFVAEMWRAREAAIRIARRACDEQGWQLLDFTVRGTRLRFARDGEGIVRVRRTFVFDYSDTGFSRRSGFLVMLGANVEALRFESDLAS
jgi:hypothetical protein